MLQKYQQNLSSLLTCTRPNLAKCHTNELKPIVIAITKAIKLEKLLVITGGSRPRGSPRMLS